MNYPTRTFRNPVSSRDCPFPPHEPVSYDKSFVIARNIQGRIQGESGIDHSSVNDPATARFNEIRNRIKRAGGKVFSLSEAIKEFCPRPIYTLGESFLQRARGVLNNQDHNKEKVTTKDQHAYSR